MGEHFTPELGQMAFSNGPWQSHPMPPFIERGLMDIAETIAEKRNDEGYLTGNWGEEPWDSEVFSMRTYCWCDGDRPGHEDGCPPNFVHHSTGFTASWYKHVGRGASVSAGISRGTWRDIVTACLMDVERSHPPRRPETSAVSDAEPEFNQCPHEVIRATCPGCKCPCDGCERWRQRESSAVSDRDAGREENTE